MSLTNAHQPVRLWQVISQKRAPETGQRSRHGRLRQQWRRYIASIQVQEQSTEPLSERHLATHDGGEGGWRRLGPQEEEPLWVVQLQRLWSRCRLPGVVLRNRGQLCLSNGWEMPLLYRRVENSYRIHESIVLVNCRFMLSVRWNDTLTSLLPLSSFLTHHSVQLNKNRPNRNFHMAPQSSLTLINLWHSTESQKLCEIQL